MLNFVVNADITGVYIPQMNRMINKDRLSNIKIDKEYISFDFECLYEDEDLSIELLDYELDNFNGEWLDVDQLNAVLKYHAKFKIDVTDCKLQGETSVYQEELELIDISDIVYTLDSVHLNQGLDRRQTTALVREELEEVVKSLDLDVELSISTHVL